MNSHHLFKCDDGNLYDTRDVNWSRNTPLRSPYCYHHRDIKTVAQFKATLRAGQYAWPGGYPLYFITSDGAALSFEAARKECRNIFDSIANHHSDGWRVVACDVNYEDTDLFCDHSNQRIECAYGDNDDEIKT